MSKGRPLPIIIIAVVTILIAINFLVDGGSLVLAGNMLMAYGSIGYSIGGLFRIIGVVWLLLGAFSIFLAVGLLLMMEWARVHGVLFYEIMALLSFVFCLFNPFLLLYGTLYLVFFSYLKKRSTRDRFETYGYEKPSPQRRMESRPSMAVQAGPEPAPKFGPPVDTGLKVPDNMMLCPNCETLNLKSNDFCKVCATELHPKRD
jgi:hypothetical protein